MFLFLIYIKKRSYWFLILILFIIIVDDHSRIVLNDCDINVPGSDYINANMINVIIYNYIFLNHKSNT